jgi:hypothetical protein
MTPFAGGFELIQRNEQIALRSRQMGVTEHSSQAVQIAATFQQVTGEGSSHVVRDDVVGKAGSLGVSLEYPPDGDAIEGMA